MWLSQGLLEGAAADLATILDWVCYTIGIGVSLLLCCGIVPILAAVERGRDKIFQALLTLPVSVVNQLAAIAERNRRRIRIAVESDMDGYDDSDGESDEDEDAGGEDPLRLQEGLDGVAYYDVSGTGGGGDVSGGVSSATDWMELFQREEERQAKEAKKREKAARRARVHAGPLPLWRRLLCCCRCRPRQSVAPQPPSLGHDNGAGSGSADVTIRPYRKGPRSVLSLAIYLLPALFSLIWFMALRSWSLRTITDVTALSGKAALSVSRTGAMRRALSSTMTYMGSYGFPAEMDAYWAGAMDAARELVNLQSILTHSQAALFAPDLPGQVPYAPPDWPAMTGDEGTGIDFVPPDVRSQMARWSSGDLCGALEEETSGGEEGRVAVDGGGREDVASCRAVSQGLYRGGMQALVVDMAAALRTLIQGRAEAYLPPDTAGDGLGTRYSLTQQLVSVTAGPSNSSAAGGLMQLQPPAAAPPPLEAVESSAFLSAMFNASASLPSYWSSPFSLQSQLASTAAGELQTHVRYGLVASERMTALYTSAADASIRGFKLRLEVMLIASCVVYGLLMISSWLSSVLSLQRDMCDKQNILCLLPAEVCGRSPPVLALMGSILASSDAASSSSSGGSGLATPKAGANNTNNPTSAVTATATGFSTGITSSALNN